MGMSIDTVITAVLGTPVAVIITFMLVRAAATAWFKTRNEFNNERRN